MLRNTIRDKLIKNRSELSDSSLKTYISTLTQLYKNLSDDFSESSYDSQVFKRKKEVLAFLNNPENNRNAPSKRKSVLSSLVVLTGDDDYRKNMNRDISKYNDQIDKQEKTKAQKESWITKEEIDEKYKEAERFVKNFYRRNKNPKHISVEDLQKIQNYIILSVLSGVHISPRRRKVRSRKIRRGERTTKR